jgi:hypothetical protein
MTPSTESLEPAVPATDACDVCGHSMQVHDRISTRYCNATQTSGLTRGCMCPAGSPVLA